jgi:hypothetical protein
VRRFPQAPQRVPRGSPHFDTKWWALSGGSSRGPRDLPGQRRLLRPPDRAGYRWQCAKQVPRTLFTSICWAEVFVEVNRVSLSVFQDFLSRGGDSMIIFRPRRRDGSQSHAEYPARWPPPRRFRNCLRATR